MYYVDCRLPLQLKGIVFHFLYTIYIMALPVVQHNWVTLQEELTVSIVSVLFLFFFCTFELSGMNAARVSVRVRMRAGARGCEGRGKGLWGHMEMRWGHIKQKKFALHYTMVSALHYGLCTTTTVSRIVARDDVHEFSTGCGNFAPKKVTTLCIRIPGPNLIYKISSST